MLVMSVGCARRRRAQPTLITNPLRTAVCRMPIMNFNNQDRECVVTLSAAKGLSRWAERCFAALSMTGPVLVVKVHYRASRRVRIYPARVADLSRRMWIYPACHGRPPIYRVDTAGGRSLQE